MKLDRMFVRTGRYGEFPSGLMVAHPGLSIGLRQNKKELKIEDEASLMTSVQGFVPNVESSNRRSGWKREESLSLSASSGFANRF